MTLNAEWIDYMGAWRLYNTSRPESTVAYYDNLNALAEAAAESGYGRLIIDLDRQEGDNRNECTGKI